MWESILLKEARSLRKEEVKTMQKYSSGVSFEMALGEGISFMSYIVTLGALNVFSGEAITL